MSENENTSDRTGRWTRQLGTIALALVLAGAGWFFRGLLGPAAAGPPPMGPMGPGGPPAVMVEKVVRAPLDLPEEFIGHVEAVQSVDLLAHVAGYIETVHFDEGGTVNAGDLLVTLRQDDYRAAVTVSKAALAQAEANHLGAGADVEAAKANVDAAQADLDRADKFLKRLREADKRSIVQADLDTAEAAALQCKARVRQAKAQLEQASARVVQAEAAIQQAKASLELAEIDLAYTEVRAPIAGRIGRAMFTKGELVGPTSGPLARLVQVDPIRVVYSLPDRRYLNLLADGGVDGQRAYDIRLRMPDGQLYGSAGTWEFEDNEMNTRTAGIAVRAAFDNAAGRLAPGAYVDVLLAPSDAPQVLLAPEEAIVIDAASASVFVVDAEGKVQPRPVKIGRSVGGQCEILSGLAEGEQVIIQGLQKVRPGSPVTVIAATTDEGDRQ